MNETALNPIPEGSVVTSAMVDRWLSIYTDDNRVTAIGTLVGFSEGRGELPAHVFDAPEHREIFSELRDVYFRQKGVNPPPYSVVEGAEVNEEAGEEVVGTGAESVSTEGQVGEASSEGEEAASDEAASEEVAAEGSEVAGEGSEAVEDESEASGTEQAEA